MGFLVSRVFYKLGAEFGIRKSESTVSGVILPGQVNDPGRAA